MIEKDESGRFWGAIGALAAFGLAYNYVVGWLDRRGYSEGYTAILVALGTLGTLAAAWPLIGARRLGQVLALFTASGAPMIAGSIARYARARGEFAAWRLNDGD